MSINETFGKLLEKALLLDFPYADRSQKRPPFIKEAPLVPAAVLLLFAYPRSDHSSHSEPSLLLIRRTEFVETHKGQMAFPGGQCEPADQGSAAFTALRETEEEVGIHPQWVEVLGELPTLITATSFSIQPVVGFMNRAYDEAPLRLNQDETEEAIWIPLEKLLEPETYRQETLNIGTETYPIDVYQVSRHRIWGATGSMIKNLLDRIQRARES